MRRVFRDYVFDGVSRLRGLQLPVDGDEAANKDYVDTLVLSPTRYTKSAQWQMTDGSAIVVTTPTTSGVQTLQDAGAIVRWTITGEGGPGSCEVGVYISTFAAGPPDSGDSVTGGNNPEIVAGHQSDDATLTGWTTAVTAGSQISMVLLSSSSFTKLTICLEIQRT